MVAAKYFLGFYTPNGLELATVYTHRLRQFVKEISAHAMSGCSIGPGTSDAVSEIRLNPSPFTSIPDPILSLWRLVYLNNTSPYRTED